MPKVPDPRAEEARKLFNQGLKLIEIAERLGIPVGTVRSWKNRYGWGNATEKKPLQKERCNVAKRGNGAAKRKRGAPPGNKNATGGPPGNKKAEKYGFFSKYLPEETKEIFDEIENADPLDLLWHQIKIAYTAIIRAQQIAYVKDREDKTIEKVEYKKGNVTGETWEVQEAWDKQNEFMKAQARAQSELRSMIKQYDEMLHRDWDLATEEQKTRIEVLKAKTQEGGDASGEELVRSWAENIMAMRGGKDE